MNRLIASHLAVAAFVAAIVASWKTLVICSYNDTASLVVGVAICSGLTLWFALTQAAKALHEARQAVLYPAKVRSIAQRFDLQDGC